MINFRVLPSLLGISIVLTGCTVGPRYAAPQSPAIVLTSPQKEAFAATRPAAQASDAWWTFFEENRLTQLIDIALEHNHDIAQAQANLRAARAVFDDRSLDQLPAVTAQASYERTLAQQRDATGDIARVPAKTYRAGFDAQWEIDLFGRLNRLAQSAHAQAEAAQADLDLVRLTIAADVARSYFEHAGLAHKLHIAQAQAQSWRETESLARARVDSGNGLPEDLENARANVQRSLADIPMLQASLQASALRLDVLTGLRPGHAGAGAESRYATQLPSAPLARQLPLGDVDALIRHRPDVVRAERLLAASVEDVGAATADLYPRLNLGGFIGFFALRGGDIGSAARAFELGPSVSWPALRLGNVRARLRGSQARSDAALARYEQAILVAQEDVENAVTQLVQHQQRLVSLLQAARHGAAALDIASRRYRAGAGSYTVVLENQRALFALEQSAADAQTTSYIYAIALYKALGWGARTR